MQVYPISFLNYQVLEGILDKINKNYQAGTTDKGYLVP
jgi:hypothetical protein